MSAINQDKNKSELAIKSEGGFSLVEVVVATLVMTIMLLGTLSVFTYAVQYNRGNNLRSQALTIMQQEAELFRSSKFTPAVRDTLLDAGVKATKTPTAPDNTVFDVNVTVDNDPVTDGIQTTNEDTCTLKEIKIKVSPKNAQAAWEKAIATDVTIQRVQGN